MADMMSYRIEHDDHTGYETLFRGDKEITTITEPEDRNFYRDLAPIIDELSNLERENKRLRKQVECLKCCGACEHGEPTCIDVLRCFGRGEPYLPVSVGQKACNNFEPRRK